MKRVSKAVGEVLNLTWTNSGLAVCYTNSNVRLCACHFFIVIIAADHFTFMGHPIHVCHVS